MQVENLAVPLYKRMFLDAPNASTIMRSLLHHSEYGLEKWANLGVGENVIIRMFMASTRSYKNYRIQTLHEPYVRQLYSLIPMPRFVWVCELYTMDKYDELEAFGEIVIDATSAPNRGQRSMILMHYQNILAYRHPDQAELGFEYQAKIENDNLFPGYRKNLDEIK